jgi:hypothetical protein
MAALATTAFSQILSEAVSTAAVYRSIPVRLDGRSRDITISYITTGTPTGTLIVEFSTSGSHLIDLDRVGSKDGTDNAVWQQYMHLFQVDGSPGHTVSITTAVSDYFDLTNAPGAALRVRYTHASGSGTIEVTVNTRTQA